MSALTVQAPTRRLVVDGRSVTVVRGPIVGAGGGVSDHGALTGRDAADSHPLAAVTGLTDALAGKTAGGEAFAAFSTHPGTLSAPWDGTTVLVVGDPAGLYAVDAAGTLVMSRSTAEMAGEVWSAQVVDPLTAPRAGAAFVAVDLTAFGGGAGLVEVGGDAGGPTRTVLPAGPVIANTTAVSSLLASPIVLPTIGTNGEADIDLAFDLRCNVAAASMLLTLVVGGVTVWVSGSSPQSISQSATGRHAGPIRVRLWRDSASQMTWDVSSMVTVSTTGTSSIRSSAGVAAVDVSGATVDLLVTFNVASALLTAQTVRGVVTVWQP